MLLTSLYLQYFKAEYFKHIGNSNSESNKNGSDKLSKKDSDSVCLSSKLNKIIDRKPLGKITINKVLPCSQTNSPRSETKGSSLTKKIPSILHYKYYLHKDISLSPNSLGNSSKFDGNKSRILNLIFYRNWIFKVYTW